MQNNNPITKDQLKTYLQGVGISNDEEAKPVVDAMISKGAKIEGINYKNEPNIAQTLAGGLLKPSAALGETAGAGVVAGYKSLIDGGNFLDNYKNASKMYDKSGEVLGNTLFGESVKPAQNLEQLGGQVLGTAATLIPGATIPKMALSGAALLGGNEMMNDGSVSDVAKGAALGGLVAGGLGVLGAGLTKLASISKPIEKEIQTGLSKGIRSDEIASGILNRQLKLNPITGNAKFQELSGGMLPGDYLVKKGIFDTREGAVNALAQDWARSYNLKKETLAQLPNQYTFNPANEALKELIAYEKATGVAGTSGKFTNRINELNKAANTRGLTANEIDDIKNIYENTVKLGYNKEINTVGIEKATRIDNALRKFVEDKAVEQGFTNVAELNKNTQLSRFLAQAIEDKVAGQASNNFLTLTDTIIGSGAVVDPSALVVLAGKKIIGSERVQAELAKKFAKSIPTDIKANITESTPALLNSATNKVETNFLVAPKGSKVGQFESTTKKIATSGQKTNQATPQQLKEKVSPLTESIPQSKKAATKKVDKSIPKELQPLAEEARKYKSAEEFVKAQGDYFHGTSNKIEGKLGDKTKGIWLAEDLNIANKYIGDGILGTEGEVYYVKPTSKLNIKDIYQKGDFSNFKELTPELETKLIKEGYDGIRLNDAVRYEKDMGSGAYWDKSYHPSIRIFGNSKNKLQSLTKSQLIDLWNKANGKK